MIENGWYWHFKGGLYEVIGTATHTETNEEMVIYRSINDIKTERSIDYKPKIYVRPASMWNDIVNGVERFQYIGRTLPKPIHRHERHQEGLKSLKVQKATFPKN